MPMSRPYARVTLLPSQQVLSVEQGETILDAALRAGLNLPLVITLKLRSRAAPLARTSQALRGPQWKSMATS